MYADVEDVDLYVGGILEQPVLGSLLGPTFQCIVGDQFARLKVIMILPKRSQVTL